MATLTLKNVPDRLHRKLKARARKHGRSLNREAIMCLEEATRVDHSDLVDWLENVRSERARCNLFLRQEEVERAIESGRK